MEKSCADHVVKSELVDAELLMCLIEAPDKYRNSSLEQPCDENSLFWSEIIITLSLSCLNCFVLKGFNYFVRPMRNKLI